MILDELAAHARERVAADKARISLADMKARAEALPKGDFRFEKALAGRDCAFICEVKKASPSKGVIDPDFDYLAIARAYAAAGTDAISCLTEPHWFLGSNAIFRAVRGAVSVPLVLHGASGIPDEDIRRAVEGGITKINIFTELTQQAAVELSACAADGYNIFSVSKAIRTGTRDRCLQKIRLFGTRR